MNRLKQEKGSISLFVTIAMLFFLMYLVGMYMLSASAESGVIEETAKIKEIYEQDVNNIDDVYATLINNKTATIKNENKNVNAPVYANIGLTPVIINEDGTTTNASTLTSNWYSYDGTKNYWANAKTADGSMWVWIPRFAYKINYTDITDKSQGGTIDVVFLKDTTKYDFNGNDVTSNDYIDENGKTGAYTIHPAFENGTSNGFANGEWDKEIPGFWMAKFEAGYDGNANNPNSAIDSNTEYSTIMSYNGLQDANYSSNYYGTRDVGTLIKYPVFKANRPSMNYIGINDAFNLCKNMNTTDNPYGLSKIANTHLTKNSEWGAVAYLTHSKYGRNVQQVSVNNVTLDGTNTVYAVTGYGEKTVDEQQTSVTMESVNTGTLEGNWLTQQGQKASTTGNLYGIYDLSGGLWEWTAGYIAPTGNYETYGGSLIGESDKYKSKYAGTSATDTQNYNETANISRKGEAIWETSLKGTGTQSWNGDNAYFVWNVAPFFARGSEWFGQANSGIFAFGNGCGYCYYNFGFRAVLIVE